MTSHVVALALPRRAVCLRNNGGVHDVLLRHSLVPAFSRQASGAGRGSGCGEITVALAVSDAAGAFAGGRIETHAADGFAQGDVVAINSGDVPTSHTYAPLPMMGVC